MNDFKNALIYMGFLLFLLVFGLMIACMICALIVGMAILVYDLATKTWDPLIYWYLGFLAFVISTHSRTEISRNEKEAARYQMRKELGLPKDFEL